MSRGRAGAAAVLVFPWNAVCRGASETAHSHPACAGLGGTHLCPWSDGTSIWDLVCQVDRLLLVRGWSVLPVQDPHFLATSDTV